MSEPGRARRVIVTAGSGKAGKYVVQEFVEHGYSVLNHPRSAARTREKAASLLERRSTCAG